VSHHRKIVVIWCNFKCVNNILNSEILLNLMRKMKYIFDRSISIVLSFRIGNTK